jgi:hypothetical protein
LQNGAFVQAGYTSLDLRAAAVTQLSKYVLDYAPHGCGGGGRIPLPGPCFWPATRSTSTGHGQLRRQRLRRFDLRISKAFGAYQVWVDGTNLFDASYQEVLNVQMPGAAVAVALSMRLGSRGL